MLSPRDAQPRSRPCGDVRRRYYARREMALGPLGQCLPGACRSSVRSVRRGRRVAECAIQQCPQCAWWASAPIYLILGSCHGARFQSKGACIIGYVLAQLICITAGVSCDNTV
eukprot:IDg23330t1